MRNFDYVGLENQKWDSETVAYIAAIHQAKGRQQLYPNRLTLFSIPRTKR